MDYPKDSLAGATATRANAKPGVTPVLILCDNSGSMKGYVDTVNQCLIGLIQDLKRNTVLANKIDLSIATFNTGYTSILPFTMVNLIDVSKIPKVVESDLATYLGTALSRAVKELSNEKALYKASEAAYTQPNLIVMSDGYPEYEDADVTATGIKDVQEKIRKERWNSIPIFIGHDYGSHILQDISVPDARGNTAVITFDSSNKSQDIIAAFKFASMSVAAVAEAARGDTYQAMPTSELQEKIRATEKRIEGLQNGLLHSKAKKKSFWDKLGF